MKSFSRWDGWVVAFGGGMVLLGWVLGNEVLKRIFPGLTAMNGLQGMTCFAEHKREIAVLVSDTDMPILDGIVTIRAIQQLKPALPIILASGGRNDTSHLQRIDTTHVTTLGKPFTVEQLLEAVAKAIPRSPKTTD